MIVKIESEIECLQRYVLISTNRDIQIENLTWNGKLKSKTDVKIVPAMKTKQKTARAETIQNGIYEWTMNVRAVCGSSPTMIVYAASHRSYFLIVFFSSYFSHSHFVDLINIWWREFLSSVMVMIIIIKINTCSSFSNRQNTCPRLSLWCIMVY